MADIKLAYASPATITSTALQSLADSATAGWQSAAVDNTTNLYEDALLQLTLTHANTAPAGDKCSYVFAYGTVNASYSHPASGSEGAITVVTVASNPMVFKQIGVVPYNVQNATVTSQPMSVAAAFGGVLPPKWGVVVVNRSGAAYSTSCVAEYVGVYRTVT